MGVRRRWRRGRGGGGRGACGEGLTGSSASTVTFSSSLVSTELFSLMVMFPEPISPVTENLTASFATAIVTVSPRIERSRQIFWNSPEGMVTSELYSVSGMPRCSLSITMSIISKSEIFSWLGLSNMKVTTSASCPRHEHVRLQPRRPAV